MSAIANDDKDLTISQLKEELLVCKKDLHETKEHLFKRYFIDNLTGLPNIYQLRKDLMENEEAGIIFIKIDNFYTLNNFYGFVIGDYILEKVSAFLKNKMQTRTIYRNSGAEFAIYLENNMSFYELKDYLTSLYNEIKNLSIEYREIKIYTEFTLASCANTNTADILSKVSMAMKYANDNNVSFWIYEDRMHFENEYEKNLTLASVVRHAVEDSRIVPYFQPIVDNETLKVTKFECLARLIDDGGNVVSPNLFISVAKKIKVYNRVTQIIIEKSFEAFENNDFEFNMNLSIEDIMSSDIFEFIIKKLKASKASSRVTFELLESEAIQDFNKVDRFIKEVKRYGAKIAIDDFGSGYSNFSYLTKINVDFLKIDGSLIKNIDTDNNSYIVVESIVHFANKLEVQTIAEFVHSSDVMDKVKELGIDFSQGYYLGKPSLFTQPKNQPLK